ncbi:Lipoprotein [Vibrio crassostreae]|nr:Lipoprotein [Vibrio crassostreae]CAK3436715.1 Lipoprotein [Vibrio crassostreae]CAK3943099.1 Lipoprotein [Vibrio crassostreae]
MKKIGLIVGLLASVSLVGCGGGGGSDATATPTTSKSFSGNGIYVNSTDLAVMIVDSTRAKNNLVVGDFANNGVYFVGSATTTENQMKTTGVTYADASSFLKDSNQTMTANFTGGAVALTAVFNGSNLAYSMDKTADSLLLSQITGTHANPDDGSTWTFNADGSFVVNGICTISGNLERNGAYFNVNNATAVSCAQSSMNGTYSGVFLTVKHGGKDYVAGLLGNDTSLLWGSAPKS